MAPRPSPCRMCEPHECPDFGGFEPHERYTIRLKAEHGRKGSFWMLVS